MTNTEHPEPAGACTVDVSPAVNDALKQVDEYIDSDPVYAELMATYAELGGVLQGNRHITAATKANLPAAEVQRFEQDCRDLIDRLIALGQRIDLESEQEWARWRVRNMNMDGIER